jgi:hypothetical protein
MPVGLGLYSKPRLRDPLSLGANHFHEHGGVPNKLATELYLSVYITADGIPLPLFQATGSHHIERDI